MKISPQSRLRPISPFSYVGRGHRGHKVDREWTRIDANQNDDLIESNSIRVNSRAFVASVPLRVLCASVVNFLT